MGSSVVRTVLAFVVALPAALAAELMALMEVIVSPDLGGLHLAAVFGLHFFASVAVAEGLALRYAPGDRGGNGGWRTALVLSLAIPIFGVVLAAIMLVHPPRTIRVKVDDFMSPMEFRAQQAEAELAAEADKGHADVNVEAIGDALKDTDKAKRLGAIEALRALENKDAVDMLGRSLKNTVFEVRFHAVEALAGINKKYSDRIAKATTALERDPTPAKHRVLADVYHEYASLEAEEESIQQHLYRSAVRHYRDALAPGKDPDPDVLIRTAECLEKTGSHQEAFHTYKAALAARPDSWPALMGMAALQFEQGQFDQLRDTCRQLVEHQLAQHEDFREQLPVLTMWAEGLEAVRAG